MFRNNYDRRTFVGIVIAFFAALSMNTIFISYTYFSRLGLALLLLIIFFYAIPGRFKVGQCPQCGASPKQQIRTLVDKFGKPASKTENLNDSIGVSQGWDISFIFDVECKNCKMTRTENQIFYIPRKKATTLSAAIILATAQSNQPS